MSLGTHDIEDKITRAIAERCLILRDLLSEEDAETAKTSVVAIIETHTEEPSPVQEVAKALRQPAGINSIDLTTKDSDAE